MTMKKESNVYSFWNGKNLNGKQEFVDITTEHCSSCEFSCVEGTETVSADDLS